MQEPPAEGQVSTVGFKVGAAAAAAAAISRRIETAVFAVLEADGRRVKRIGRKRDDAREVIAPSEQIELNAREDVEQRQSINERKGPRHGWKVYQRCTT